MKSPALPGAASPANSSSSSDPRAALARELLLLLAAGLLVELLHQSLRWPLKLPGHHGLEWFAILMGARLLSSLPGAALAVAIGASLGAMGLLGGEVHGVRAGIYLVQGLVVDGLFLLLRGRAAWWLLAPVLGGLAHAMSPLIKNLIQGPGLSFGSLTQGLAWPLSTHAAFGAVGALAGALAVYAVQRSRKPPAPR